MQNIVEKVKYYSMDILVILIPLVLAIVSKILSNADLN